MRLSAPHGLSLSHVHPWLTHVGAAGFWVGWRVKGVETSG